MFQRNVLPPSSGLKKKPSSKQNKEFLAYSLTLKMEAVHSSET
jgi:hypothetical protein